MTIHTLYRIGIWLPVLVPSLVAGLVHGLGVPVRLSPLDKIVQILLGSLLYGGLPYATLAVWATWWIGDRPEPEITRVMLRAPLLMMAACLSFWLVVGVWNAVPLVGLSVGVLGALVTLPLGCVYVGLMMLLRKNWRPRVA